MFTLGLMTKPMLVTLPVILLLLDYWPLGRPQNLKYLIFEKMPLFLLSAASAIITIIVQKQTGAVKDIVQYSLIARFANALISYVNYIEKMFWPTKLSIFYPHPGNTFEVSTAIICGLLLVVITGLVILQVRTRGYLFVGWTWYIVTLLPVIGLVQVGNQAMADRYTYIPLIGLFIMIAWGAQELLANYNFRKPVLAVAATASVIAMSVVTYVNLGYWQNSETVLEHAIEVTQYNRFAQANLGAAYLQKSMYDQAIVHLEKVIQNDPCDAMANLNLGVALFRKGKIDDAIVHFEKSLQNNPRDVSVRLNLGVDLTKQGRVKEAIKYCDEAMQIDPCNVDALNLKQKLLMQQQK
jgi:tetratricopeptide (TPR) repeat protein